MSTGAGSSTFFNSAISYNKTHSKMKYAFSSCPPSQRHSSVVDLTHRAGHGNTSSWQAAPVDSMIYLFINKSIVYLHFRVFVKAHELLPKVSSGPRSENVACPWYDTTHRLITLCLGKLHHKHFMYYINHEKNPNWECYPTPTDINETRSRN